MTCFELKLTYKYLKSSAMNDYTRDRLSESKKTKKNDDD